MTTGILLHQRLGHSRRGQVAISALCGLSLLGVAAGLALSWRDSLPDPVATHWSSGDGPDGFMPVGSFVGVLVAAGAVCVALFSAMGVFWGRGESTRRLSAAMNVWIGGFIGTILVGSLWVQRGLSDAAEAWSPGWLVAAAALGPTVLAVIAAMLVPGDPPAPATGPVDGGAARTPLGPGERAAWIGRATTPRGALAVEIGIALAATAAAVLTQLWAMLVVPLLLALLVLAMLSFTVRVDGAGLTVRSTLGWPRTRIPADEVVLASATTVSPMRDYGGWGWRVALDGSGRTGVVLRRGEALQVDRTAGRGFVVTVDGAAQAAALLNTMAERARAERGTGPGDGR
ncbi:DUF1648 domain-containing protein [Promicromonospora sp. NPDC052451]|uniref:DUF1648 domain-containing protein n=1 Tax=Promicromonospora sp. NPDC052451 TaxID=3364407 RepID=UPI0037C6F23D